MHFREQFTCGTGKEGKSLFSKCDGQGRKSLFNGCEGQARRVFV